jgi:hypothetical protein
MKICSICSYNNEPIAKYCAGCGQRLLEVTRQPTERQELAWKLRPRNLWGDMRLPQDAVLVMHILTAIEPLMLPRRERLVIGRAGASGLRHPDVDLTSWGAIQYGVSRLHAAFEIRDEAVFLTDLGSTNGTYLNAARLSPGETRIVCSGDELCFGNLVAHLYFRNLAELGNS